MDDTGEAEVLRDAALILVRQTWRAYRDVRAGVLTCGAELWHQSEPYPPSPFVCVSVCVCGFFKRKRSLAARKG